MTRSTSEPAEHPPPPELPRPEPGLPTDLRFHFVRADEHGRHRVCAMVADSAYGSREIGLVVWDPLGGEVQYIHTAHDMRRRGVATALWMQARDYARREGLTGPRHSTRQTREGAAWALALEKLLCNSFY